MPQRLTITFPNSEVLKLQTAATEKGISLAQHIRNLVNFGSQVESNLKISAGQKKIPKLDAQLKILWENNLLCIFESRYLSRYILNQLIHDTPDKMDAILKAVKEKTQTMVAELLKE